MVLIGHSQRVAQPLTRRQRLVIALIAAAVVGAALWAALQAASAPSSGAGCVTVVAASSLGGVTVHRCGAQARSWCRTELARTDPFALRVQAECRLAGLERRRGRS